MSVSTDYPVQVRGQYDGSLSCWLWLVKIFLALPHVLVLMLLWPIGLMSVILAFGAILATKRFPRRLFNLQLAVMRYQWRVDFYVFEVGGTDRYPPFTLGAAEDYPATLDIAYPEAGLSRVKVLFKWILAFPHLLITSSLGSGMSPLSLHFYLQFFALITLLFKGHYHRDMFDLIMGLNRWNIRVGAYMLLMTDEYPPFRLD